MTTRNLNITGIHKIILKKSSFTYSKIYNPSSKIVNILKLLNALNSLNIFYILASLNTRFAFNDEERFVEIMLNSTKSNIN
jgi:hypothetical protein